MFISGQVTDWRTHGNRRVLDKTNGTWYILNTNRMFEITENYAGYAHMRFFDNPADERDGGAWLTIKRTVALVILSADNEITSVSITLPIYPNNDPTETPVNTTIGRAHIAYVKTAGSDYATDTTCWVTYVDDAWDVKTVLVHYNLVVLYVALLA